MEHITEGTLLMAEDDESFWEVWSWKLIYVITERAFKK
jgi:hypothetical protein